MLQREDGETKTKRQLAKHVIILFNRWAVPAEDSPPPAQQPDPEALPDYPDHCPTTHSYYPDQTILPDYSDYTTLPDYTDTISPSAPPAEFATILAAEAAASAATRLDQNGYEAPPSYDAAMRGEI